MVRDAATKCARGSALVAANYRPRRLARTAGAIGAIRIQRRFPAV
jgi:hypothetical protein